MNTRDFTTYKNVIIYNIRNARNNSKKVMIRDIATIYLADKWSEGGEAVRSCNSLKLAHDLIDRLLIQGATVCEGRIVTTLGDFDLAQFEVK
jgi:hypothetical protein